MHAPTVTKFVVNNLTGFAIGSAARTVFRNLVPASNNVAVNLIVDASIIVTAWSVSEIIAEPILKHNNEKIDKLFVDAKSAANKNTNK